MEVHCTKIVEQFAEDAYIDRVWTELTRRDCIEQRGNSKPVILGLSELYTILYNNNMAELKANGLSCFMLVH